MKLTKEDKKRIILEEHLKDDIPLSYLARKYRVSRGSLDILKSRYMRFGESVFEKHNRTFSTEFKLSCIKRVLEDGEQKIRVALDSNIDPGTLRNWINKYEKNNGKLIDMKRGRKEEKFEINKDTIPKDVHEELLRLRAEVAYLKKLISLVQEEEDKSQEQK